MNNQLGFYDFSLQQPTKEQLYISNLNRIAAENGLINARHYFDTLTSFFIDPKDNVVYYVTPYTRGQSIDPSFNIAKPNATEQILKYNGY